MQGMEKVDIERSGSQPSRKGLTDLQVKIMSKVWCITDAGRGMSINFSQAALAAGNTVIANGITKEVPQ